MWHRNKQEDNCIGRRWGEGLEEVGGERGRNGRRAEVKIGVASLRFEDDRVK